MDYGFNEYHYAMVSVHVYVLNANLCKEVTGSLFHFLFVLYTYYLYEMYISVLHRGEG